MKAIALLVYFAVLLWSPCVTTGAYYYAAASAGGGPTVVATDNFNRANGTLGANWATITGQGASAVLNNKASTASVGSDSYSRWSANSFNDNQYAQGKLITLTSTDRSAGVVLRAASGANTFYFFMAEGPFGASTTLRIGKVVAGTKTSLTSTTATVATTDVIYGSASGTTLVLKINGVQKLSTTDSAIASGSAGLGAWTDSGTQGDAELDDWEGGNL